MKTKRGNPNLKDPAYAKALGALGAAEREQRRFRSLGRAARVVGEALAQPEGPANLARAWLALVGED